MPGSATSLQSSACWDFRPGLRATAITRKRENNPCSPSSPPASGWEMRSTTPTRSPAAVLNTTTPRVRRPAMRMASTGLRFLPFVSRGGCKYGDACLFACFQPERMRPAPYFPA